MQYGFGEKRVIGDASPPVIYSWLVYFYPVEFPEYHSDLDGGGIDFLCQSISENYKLYLILSQSEILKALEYFFVICPW